MSLQENKLSLNQAPHMLNGFPVPQYCYMVAKGIEKEMPGFIPLKSEIGRESLLRLHQNLDSITGAPEDKHMLFQKHAALVVEHVDPAERKGMKRFVKTVSRNL